MTARADRPAMAMRSRRHDPMEKWHVRPIDAFRSECPHCDWFSPLTVSEHMAARHMEDHLNAEHEDKA